ncbi:hypothetical protein DPMN_168760 [Dreissena polymorpha]|uniref:Uncharacterized protein n=1 Tax=Dreissena polymorpha TaxID=45954 RepID=A0A9D4F3Z2_DREPO|nr:hypothetical protein DPMN_168760 [Dreissena polymorpha]
MPIRSTRSSPTKRSGTVVGGGRGRSSLVGLPTRYLLTLKKYRRAGSEDRVDREASCGDRIDIFCTIYDRAEIGKMSFGDRVLSTRVELRRRDDRVDRIGSGNPP